MSEFMGLILGRYEAREGGFAPGGATLHSMMTPHGPDAKCFDDWSTRELGPIRVAENTMAFMFETCFGLSLTKWGESICAKLDPKYKDDWKGIKSDFNEHEKEEQKAFRTLADMSMGSKISMCWK